MPTPLQRGALLDATAFAGFAGVTSLFWRGYDLGWDSLLQSHTWVSAVLGAGAVGLLVFGISAGIRSLLVHRPID